MAQMGGSPTTVVPAGTYTVESHHTLAIFAINHMGFNEFLRHHPRATGSLTLDPAMRRRTSLTCRAGFGDFRPPNSVLDGELKDPSWLDAAKYPESIHRRHLVRAPNHPSISALQERKDLFSRHCVYSPAPSLTTC